MADASFSTTSGALEQRVRAKLTRQPNRASVLLNLLQKTRGSGKNVAFDVTVGTDVGTYYDDGEDVSTYNNDTELMATLPWSHVGDAFALTGTAEDVAAGEPTELANLFMKKLTDCIHRVAAKANLELISGLGTASPQKVHGICNTTGPLGATGQYANIDRGSYSQWAASVTAVSGALTMSVIEQKLEDIYIASGTQPDLIVTTPALWRRYAELVAPEKRYLQEVTIRGEVIKLDGGWSALEVNGIPMFKEKDMVTGEMAFINSQHMGVEFLPAAPRKNADFLGEVPIAGTPQEQAGNVPDASGLMARVWKLARTGDKSKYQVLTKIALWSDKCNAHGRLTGLI